MAKDILKDKKLLTLFIRQLSSLPDTSRQGMKSSREFIQLKTAYQILRDPVLRQQYDQNLLRVNRWKEKAAKTVVQNRPERSRIFYQMGGIFLLLIIAVFIFDFLYRQ